VIPKASVARGLVALSALLALALGARLASQGWPTASRSPEPVCPAPVEVVERATSHVGCADEPALAACGPLARGDLVRLEGLACARAPGGMGASRRLAVGLPLELNRASAAELELLEGIGPRLAAAIVAEREARGPFSSVAELRRVRGIGPALLAKLDRVLEVDGAPTVAPRGAP
jgi:competence ComEA-like helix-hairpin-helix protein